MALVGRCAGAAAAWEVVGRGCGGALPRFSFEVGSFLVFFLVFVVVGAAAGCSCCSDRCSPSSSASWDAFRLVLLLRLLLPVGFLEAGTSAREQAARAAEAGGISPSCCCC